MIRKVAAVRNIYFDWEVLKKTTITNVKVYLSNSIFFYVNYIVAKCFIPTF